jgi:hypothetical protein
MTLTCLTTVAIGLAAMGGAELSAQTQEALTTTKTKRRDGRRVQPAVSR